MRVNTECMRVKIKCEGENEIFMGVHKRHKSEGGKYRVMERIKGAASATGQHRMHEGENKM